MAAEAFWILMSNDRTRVAGLAIGATCAVAFLAALLWLLTGSGQAWRCVVRVHIEYTQQSQFDPDKLERLFQSASNTFSSPATQQELAAKCAVPAESFRFLGSEQIGGVTIIRLKFSGRTKGEVEALSDTAARLWIGRLAAQTPPITAELLGHSSVPNYQDIWESFLSWTRETQRRIWVFFHT
jgi:hypothetical protein